MRLRRLLTTAAAAVALATVAPSAASATTPADAATPGPWQPTRSEPFTAPAGKYCDFPLGVEIVADDEYVRVDSRYPDGTTHVEEYKGLLVVDFVDVDSGARVRRDVSGRAWLEYAPDGTTWVSYTTAGPVGFGFRAGDDYPRGYYVLRGVHRIAFDPDGTRHMVVSQGSAEDVCDALA